jgi:hypothetical protein
MSAATWAVMVLTLAGAKPTPLPKLKGRRHVCKDQELQLTDGDLAALTVIELRRLRPRWSREQCAEAIADARERLKAAREAIR